MTYPAPMYTYRYPHPALTCDCVIFGYDRPKGLRVLLIKRGIEPFKDRWALPGGFMRMNETTEECALRELREETHLSTGKVKELGVFSSLDRDPRERVVTVAYYALVKPDTVEGGDDAQDAAWFSMDALPELAFDHATILEAAKERLRRDIFFEPVGFELLDKVFTLPDLQHLYESILGVSFDRRNFANKMKALKILVEAEPRPEGTGPRIPVKYHFDKEAYDHLKEKGFRLEF